jgi:hypothetical protein
VLDAILPAILPELQAIAGLVLTALASWAVFEIKRRFGVDVAIRQINADDKLRDLLTAALVTGAKAAVMRQTLKTADKRADAAVEHVMSSIPDTIARLGATGPEAQIALKNRALAVLFDMAEANTGRGVAG